MGAFEHLAIHGIHHRYYPRCNSDHVYRYGNTSVGHVRYSCPVCPHVFQLTYTTYKACRPSIDEKIVDMTFNGADVYDTARVLNIAINTVLRAQKKRAQGK